MNITDLKRREAKAMDERVLAALMQHGPMTGRDLLQAVEAPAGLLIGRCIELVFAGRLTIDRERRFAVRGTR